MSSSSRRRFVRRSGYVSLLALAGCLQRTSDEGSPTPTRADDWCLEELDSDVRDAYRTAESIDGIQREPDALLPKADAAYQCYPLGSEQCSNCRFFVPYRTAEDLGGCTEVEGEVRTMDWCARYEPTDRLDDAPSLDNVLDGDEPTDPST